MLRDYLKDFPPGRVRLLARSSNGLRMLTNAEIALAAGIAESTVVHIYNLPDWSSVKTGIVDRFLAACGVDPRRKKKHIRMVLKNKKVYIRRAKPHQLKLISKIIGAAEANAGSVPPHSTERLPHAD